MFPLEDINTDRIGLAGVIQVRAQREDGTAEHEG